MKRIKSFFMLVVLIILWFTFYTPSCFTQTCDPVTGLPITTQQTIPQVENAVNAALDQAGEDEISSLFNSLDDEIAYTLGVYGDGANETVAQYSQDELQEVIRQLQAASEIATNRELEKSMQEDAKKAATEGIMGAVRTAYSMHVTRSGLPPMSTFDPTQSSSLAPGGTPPAPPDMSGSEDFGEQPETYGPQAPVDPAQLQEVINILAQLGGSGSGPSQ